VHSPIRSQALSGSAPSRRVPGRAAHTVLIVLALLATLLLFLGLCQWGFMAGPAARIASRAMHRQVQIGRLSAHLLRWTPTLTITDLRVANTSWARSPYLARIGSITAGIEPWQLLRGRLVLSELQIQDPQLDLQRDAQRRENWQFNAAAQTPQPKKPATPMRLPAVNLFSMRGGSITISDAIRKLTFQGGVAANEHAAHPELEPLSVRGHGTLNGKPFELTLQGSALFNLQLDQPYHFNASVVAGPLNVAAQGQVDKPFDFAHFGAALDIRGQNLAALYYLTGLALPFTPPFHVRGQLRNDDEHFSLRQLQATVGNSDLSGEIGVDATRATPRLTANLVSHSLDLADLAPSVGAGVPNQPTQSDLAAPSANKTAQGLLPRYQFQFDRLREMDARVRLHADSIQTSKVPLKALDLGVNIDDAQLSIDPLQLTLPQGQLSGLVRIDTRRSPAVAALDLRLRDVRLAQFHPAKSSQSPIEGLLESRLQLKGSGNSVQDILGHSEGLFTAVIPEGAVRKAFAEFTGINAARGLGLLVTGNQQQTTIRCALAAFAVHRGLAQAQQFVLSTDAVQVTGSGNINFDTERLDLVLRGHPKKLSLFHIYAPIVIDGTFTMPSFGVKPGGLVAQAGVAAALGVLATPAAAILAFVDPGLTRDADCTALLANPQARSAQHPGAPHASPQAPAPKPAG
jgi:AsmA family protein